MESLSSTDGYRLVWGRELPTDTYSLGPWPHVELSDQVLSSLQWAERAGSAGPSLRTGSVQITSRVFFGEPGPWFNQLDMDGDKTSVFHDVDGSVSEYPGSYLTKDDNWLVRHPDCIDIPDWRGAICSGHYAQVGRESSG